MRSSALRRSGWPGAIVLCGIAAYLPSFNGVFIFDDMRWIVDNDALQQLWPPWAAARGSLRPLLFFTLAINHAISGLAPWSYHVVNLLIHLGAALLLFGVLRRALGNRRVSIGPRHITADALAGSTALLWVVHPLTTQAVTYVIQRGESLASLLMLLCFYALLRSSDRASGSDRREPSRRGRRGWWVVVLASWWAAMATKQIAVTVPVLLILFDVLVLTGRFRETWKARRVLYLALWVPIGLGVVALLMTHPEQLAGLVRGDARNFGRWDYLMSQPGVVLHYLQLVIWPRALQIDHGWPVASGVRTILPVFIAIVVLALIALGCWRRRPASFIGIWFVVILSPTSSLVPLRDLLVEHRMYLPLAAPLFLFAWLIAHLPQDRGRRAILGLIVCVLALTTAARNRDYHSELSLWARATQETDNVRRFYNLQLEFIVEEGGVLDGPLLSAIEAGTDLLPASKALQAGDTETALKKLTEATSPAADNLRGVALWLSGQSAAAMAQWSLPDAMPAASVNLAVAHWLAGDLPRAEEGLLAVSAEGSTIPEAYYNLGTLRATAGRFEEARGSLEHALTLRPGMVQALNNLGAIDERLGATQRAIASYEQARASGHNSATLNRALLYVRQRQYRRALPLLDRVMARHPEERAASARALARYYTGELEGASQDLAFVQERDATAAVDNNFGCVRMALGDLVEARRLFERALSKSPEQAATHHNLGKLLVVIGQPWAAVPHLRQAARARPEDAVLAANLREAERLARR